jgi:hypothetical protein
MTGCKDHILTVFVFAFILLWFVKYQKTRNYWFLPLTFIFTGLLAWVRPELAFWIFLSLCIFCALELLPNWKNDNGIRLLLPFFFAPLFTIIGALPFFVNNYMVTKNIFVPAWILWNQDLAAPVEEESIATNSIVGSGSIDAIHSIFGLFSKMIGIYPDTFFSDVLGVLFFPQNGGIGVLVIVPLFLVTTAVIIILLLKKKIRLDHDDHLNLIPLLLLSGAILFAYGVKIHSLNISPGVLPDIRYLLAIYIPLNLIGLIFLQKINTGRIYNIGKLIIMIAFLAISILPSLFIEMWFYSDKLIRSGFSAPLNRMFSLIILGIAILTIICLFLREFKEKWNGFSHYLIAVLCSIPAVWQLNLIFYHCTFGQTGYTFWIPVIRFFYDQVLIKILIS